MKEAAARIKINKLLEATGWRFFADAKGPANIQLEPSVTLKAQDLDALGENFEKATKGFIDFLLLNDKGFPFIVLEAKAENKNPLVGKEQARRYAKSQNCRFVILSNGNLHYFWDLERGNPYVITAFPTPTSVTGYQKTTPDPKRLIEEAVGDDYVALTQRPGYASEAAWKNPDERPRFIAVNALRFLRLYQMMAIYAIQQAIARGLDRFLLEMATGTGKTLVAAAIIKLFLRTGNARRVLFLVDRLELEDQALKAFRKVLANDYKSVIYKENRDDWRSAEIVVTTVQSLLFNNKYQQLFSPTDFDLSSRTKRTAPSAATPAPFSTTSSVTSSASPPRRAITSRSSTTPGGWRPAAHHQLHQQQTARLRQLHPHLQDQQSPYLHHRRHDDHRL
jgi:type I restriction enzyme R subunit